MPNKNTFTIKPIKELVETYMREKEIIVDPFANNCKIGNVTNDLDDEYRTTHNMDAIEFLEMLPNNYADGVLFDPPYSFRQLSECYKKMGRSVTMETTSMGYWANCKKKYFQNNKGGKHSNLVRVE